jgi:arabinofuranosyltransferase
MKKADRSTIAVPPAASGPSFASQLDLGGLAALVLFAVAAASMQHYLIDDSFISFRYARNLVEGYGLVFNPGERVEGYTNFLWVLGIAGGLALGLSAETTAIGLGIVAAIACIRVTGWLAGALSPSRWRILGPAMLATSTPFVFWSFSGMETVAVAAFVAFGAWRFVAAGPSEVPRLGVAALSVACLLRPDALILLVTSLAALALWPGTDRSRRLLGSFLVAAAILLPYAAWKWWYYGELLPNTARAKVGFSAAQVLRGLRHTGTFFVFACAAGLVPGSLLALCRFQPERLYLASLALVQTAYVVAVGGDSFLFHRFEVPVLPILCALAAAGMEELHRALSASGATGGWARGLAGLVAAAFLLAGAGWGHQGHFRTTIAAKAALNERFRRIGLWLRERSAPDDAIAVVAAGIIPYYSRLPAIDMLGLADPHIARRQIAGFGSGMAGHEKGDGRYVLERSPRYILVHPITTSEPPTLELMAQTSRRYVSTRELWAESEFHRRYALRSVRLDGFYFSFFERRADPDRGADERAPRSHG